MKTFTGKHEKLFLNMVLLCLLSIIFSGSTPFPQKVVVKNDDSRSKKLDILEKLERGKTISSEDIRASFSQSASDDHESLELYLPEIPPFPGPFFYRDHDGIDYIICDSDLKEIHHQLQKNLEEVRKNMESFRNSEDFLRLQDEFQKWGDKFKKELEKIKDELTKSEKELRSKETVHSIL